MKVRFLLAHLFLNNGLLSTNIMQASADDGCTQAVIEWVNRFKIVWKVSHTTRSSVPTGTMHRIIRLPRQLT
jgi:hypothetical protein